MEGEGEEHKHRPGDGRHEHQPYRALAPHHPHRRLRTAAACKKATPALRSEYEKQVGVIRRAGWWRPYLCFASPLLRLHSTNVRRDARPGEEGMGLLAELARETNLVWSGMRFSCSLLHEPYCLRLFKLLKILILGFTRLRFRDPFESYSSSRHIASQINSEAMRECAST